jgi:RNA polymerase sigma factor (sigma-70 family)
MSVLGSAAAPVEESRRRSIVKAFGRGMGLAAIARRYEMRRPTVYRVIIDDRGNRLLKRKVRFHDDPLYHQADAREAIGEIMRQEELGDVGRVEDSRLPRDLPPYFRELYRTPLLSKSRERALFLKLNFHKYQFIHARRRMDLQRMRMRDIRTLESHLAAVAGTKNEIISANLRLVVSVARKHARFGAGLLELVSEGNLTLMRAVDGFDVHRGHRFSTYATLALMKGFARAAPKMSPSASRERFDERALADAADYRQLPAESRLADQDHVDRLLSRLDDRERSVLSAHFGLGADREGATYEQVGRRMGLSKERVRQIEQMAMDKLRAAGDGMEG